MSKKEKSTEKKTEAAEVPVVQNTIDEKQKFLEKLTRAGYNTVYENGVVMVVAASDFEKTAEKVHAFVKKEGYNSSYGIAIRK